MGGSGCAILVGAYHGVSAPSKDTKPLGLSEIVETASASSEPGSAEAGMKFTLVAGHGAAIGGGIVLDGDEPVASAAAIVVVASAATIVGVAAAASIVGGGAAGMPWIIAWIAVTPGPA